MTKYIGADTLIKRVKDLPTWWADGGGYYGGAMKYPEGMFEPEDVISIIENIPAADVVEVVRCRECKYWGDEAGKLQRSDGVLFARCKVHNYLLDGRHTGWCPTENDFCSYGELKEGVDNG